MAALRAWCALAWLATAAPARADPVDHWAPFIAEASARFNVPTGWIGAVMRAESGGQPAIAGRPIRSRKGAIGLMQVMPKTWQAMRALYALGADPDDPHDNILAGTAYLKAMYDRFGYPGLFAAYNAGPKRYAASLSGRPLPPETVSYVTHIVSRGGTTPVTARPDVPLPTLFAVDNTRPGVVVAGPPAAPTDRPSGQLGQKPSPSMFVPLGNAPR